MKLLLIAASIFPSRPALVSALNEGEVTPMLGALNESIASDQEWVRIAPFGEFPNKVGLQVFDREAASKMVEGFNSLVGRASRMFRGVPIYVGHPDDQSWAKANPGIRAEAVGRIRELQVRDDGLYGRTALNDEGKRLISGDAAPYEAHSPHWGMLPIVHKGKRAFRPVELRSIGLTNNPNLPGTAIGINEAGADSLSEPMKTNLIALLAALGRPFANAESATDEQLAAAINEAVPVATSALAAVTELATAKTQLTTAANEKTALETQLNELKATVTAVNERVATERSARVGLVLTGAINEGRITAAQRAEWENKFNAQGADFAAIETELSKVKRAINTQSRVGALGTRKEEETVSTERMSAINTAVAEKQRTSNLQHHEAYLAVKREKPELFANAAQ